MQEKTAKKVSRFRDRVNSYFFLNFKKNLLKQNERGIADLEEDCLTERNFVLQIGTLATLVDDFDESVLRASLKREYQNSGSINLLEKLLKENNLQEGNIIENLKFIKQIRNCAFPYHRGTSTKFLRLIRKLGFKSSPDWNSLWRTCKNLYVNSLAELTDQLEEYTNRIEYQKEIGRERIQNSVRHESVVYLNDILYKYRVLVPLHYKDQREQLVDYLTAAIVAYEKSLKSINYALRKYVLPLKEKFKEHEEDIYFVMKRRMLAKKLLLDEAILLSRDDIGIEDDTEFRKYARAPFLTPKREH